MQPKKDENQKKTIWKKEKVTLRFDVTTLLGGIRKTSNVWSPQQTQDATKQETLGKENDIYVHTEDGENLTLLVRRRQTQGGPTLLFSFPD